MNDRDYIAATVQSGRKLCWWSLAAVVGATCWVLAVLVALAVLRAVMP